jgi:hypothetical protein
MNTPASNHCFIGNAIGPQNPSAEVKRQLKFERVKVSKKLVAAYLALVFAGLCIGLTAATHVTERTAATVSGAHIKAMY